MQRTQAAAYSLELRWTERLMEIFPLPANHLSKLKKAGVLIAIDILVPVTHR